MKKRRILMGKTHLIAGAVMLAVAGGQLSAQTVAPKKAKAYMVADAHLDTQWNWDYTKTIDVFLKRTLERNFDLFEKYPDYIFTFTGARRYRMMKEYYPDLYAKMLGYVRQGRWIAGGSCVEESEVNVSSSESMIREVLYGNAYYEREFGYRSIDYMLPDCFGFVRGVVDSPDLNLNMMPFYGTKASAGWLIGGPGCGFAVNENSANKEAALKVLAAIATKVAWIFAPLGFGNWKATVASVSGLIAKENVVGTFGVLYHFGGEELSENGDEIWSLVAADYTALSAYAFMIFNLLCAPCFAAMGAIKREMNNGKWTAIAIGYMCALAYCSALVVYQLGGIITGELSFNFFTIVAAVILVAFIYLLVRPNKYVNDNEVKIDVSKIK